MKPICSANPNPVLRIVWGYWSPAFAGDDTVVITKERNPVQRCFILTERSLQDRSRDGASIAFTHVFEAA
jgi:hypothetical protein